MIFQFAERLRRAVVNALVQERHRFAQYVGDQTLLVVLENGLYAYLDGRDASLTPSILRRRSWEVHIGRYLEANLRPGDTFVDIGANMGYHSLCAAKLVGPEGFVVSFEPQERQCRLVRRSICANLFLGHMVVERMAIGAEPGMVSLGKFEFLTGSATLTPNQGIADREEAPIQPLADALAHVAAGQGRDGIVPDIIKMDVEGFEVDTWRGMREWTRGIARLAIVIEYSPVSYRDTGHDPRALLDDFIAYGFAVHHLRHDGTTWPLTAPELDRIAGERAQYDLVLRKGPA